MKQQLVVFTKVVELKSFSKAAEELYMTQPAVSQYVQMLEQTVGSKLLERTNKLISLTRAGEIVYVNGKQILNLYNKMQNLVDDLTNHATGPISIGASYTFGEYILPHVIARMNDSYPCITPSITIGNTKEIIDLVRTHSLDIGIIEGESSKHSSLVIENFAEDTMYIVASATADISRKSDISINDLEDCTWIVREKGSGSRETVDKLFQQFNFCPSHKMEFGSTQVIKESVEAGLGVALLSSSSFRKEEMLNSLVVLSKETYFIKRHFSFVVKKTFQTKAVEVLIDLLKKNTF